MLLFIRLVSKDVIVESILLVSDHSNMFLFSFFWRTAFGTIDYVTITF